MGQVIGTRVHDVLLYRSVAADTLFLHSHEVAKQVHDSEVRLVVAQVPEGDSLHFVLMRTVVIVITQHELHVARLNVDLVHGAVGVDGDVQKAGIERVEGSTCVKYSVC